MEVLVSAFMLTSVYFFLKSTVHYYYTQPAKVPGMGRLNAAARDSWSETDVTALYYSSYKYLA